MKSRRRDPDRARDALFTVPKHPPLPAAKDEKCLHTGIEMNCNARYVLVLGSSPTHVYPLKQASKCVKESAPRNKPRLLYTKESRKSR
jgi:hypothetical protein